MKILNTIVIFAFFLLTSFASATDLRKLNPADFIGGTPKGNFGSSSSRTHATPYKYSGNKNKTIMGLYRGSSHERALDAQIRNYRASARENERVFGAPYRKTTPKKVSIEDMIKLGLVKVIIGTDGKKYLVQTK